RMHAYSRSMWMNLRRVVIFQLSAFQRPIFALFGPLRGAFGCIVMIFEDIFTEQAFCRVSPRMAA
ncbi:MAG: transposase, partial [Prevotella sp.]|nr:transposase [Prevotella sp.]